MGDLIPFDAARPPAVLANRQSTSLSAAQAGVQASFAVVGYRGRNWRLKYRGDEELLKDNNGTPLPHLDVVIVGVSPAISKQCYLKKYVEGSDDPPDCFSIDGVVPDPTSPQKQHATCATCPKNAWGSRITDDGKKAKACQDSRRLAVVPLGDIENETFGGPMLLRLPPTTLSNFANYGAMLERKGVPGFEFVATRLGFDYDLAYPKITFQALGWLNDEQAVEVVGPDGQGGVCADPQISRMLNEEIVERPASQEEPEEASALDRAGPPRILQERAAQAGTSPVVETVMASPASPAAAPQPGASSGPPTSAPAPRKRASTAFSAGAATVANGPSPTPAAPTAPPPAHENGASNGASASPSTADSDSSEDERLPARPPTALPQTPEGMMSAIDELLKQPA